MERKQGWTLEDFPKFTVLQVSQLGTDPEGSSRFEIEGEFDRPVEQQGEITWFWLLIGERNAVCAQWASLENGTSATVTIDEKELPDISGKPLRYLSPAWNPYQIWMVIDKEWGWERVQFRAVDAVAETFGAKEISMVDGREVTTWTRLRRADKQGNTERYEPDAQISGPRGGPRIVAGGWDHEHCDLCHSHIDDGNFGYRDSDNTWLCEACHKKYVEQHNLPFVDDL
jgi:hypothetical protein